MFLRSEPTVSLVETVHLGAIAGIAVLSPLEHTRSVAPSTLLVVYLSARTIGDTIELMFVHNRWSVIILTMRISLEAANLVVESQSKRLFLLEAFADSAPEEIVGFWSRVSFWWVNSWLLARRDVKFSLGALPRSPIRLEPSRLRQRLLTTWHQRSK
jgi:ATP-binding cassette subfamily C (CFTR/MRP) protein 1